MFLKELKIGNVTLENNILLAPMAGITDKAFRKVCKSYGAGLVCCEMVSSKGLYYKDEKTKMLLNTEGEQKPISMQIFGSDIETMGYAARYVSEFANILDINMGCPAPKVTKNGDGSRLLLNLELAGNIIEEVVKNSKVPVTVKLRKGWDENNIVAVELARIAEEKGAAAVIIHGRTRQEFYSRKCRLEYYKKS